ncbi:MAG TPA: hypothetical protein VGL57_14715 [Solirubrobacteraceae bacterium]|jgi:hypothetical protein
MELRGAEQPVSPETQHADVEGDDPQNTSVVVKEVIAGVVDFGRQLGELTFANVAALSALTATVLYVIGLVRRIGQLHAEDVSTTRGLGLSSLQDYLLEGLAVIVNPTIAFRLAVVAVLAAAAFVGAKLASTPAADRIARWWGGGETSLEAGAEADGTLSAAAAGSDDSANGSNSRLIRGVWGLGAAGLTLLIPVAEWGPPIAVAVAAAALVYFNLRFELLTINGWRTWSVNHARASVLTAVVMLSALAALYAYFDPPPLDQATIYTSNDQVIKGKLLAESNGLVYLVGTRDRDHQAGILAIPLTSVARMRVSVGEPRFYKTIPELLELPKELGVPFWRVELNGSQLPRFSRTGTHAHPE